MSEKSVDVST